MSIYGTNLTPQKFFPVHSVKNKAKKPKESNAALIEEVTKEEYEKLTAQ